MQAPDLIRQTGEQPASPFKRTNELLQAWTDATRLNLRHPTTANQRAAEQAHEAYKAEQNRALNLFYNIK